MINPYPNALFIQTTYSSYPLNKDHLTHIVRYLNVKIPFRKRNIWHMLQHWQVLQKPFLAIQNWRNYKLVWEPHYLNLTCELFNFIVSILLHPYRTKGSTKVSWNQGPIRIMQKIWNAKQDQNWKAFHEAHLMWESI